MPTFINNTGTNFISLTDISGNRVAVAIGETIESYERLDRTHGLTLVSESPYLPDFFLSHVFAAAGSFEYNLTSDQFEKCTEAIVHATGNSFAATVQVNSASGPTLGSLSVDDGIIEVRIALEKRVSSIIITATSAGTANIYLLQ